MRIFQDFFSAEELKNLKANLLSMDWYQEFMHFKDGFAPIKHLGFFSSPEVYLPNRCLR
jgi:hypothetical protein